MMYKPDIDSVTDAVSLTSMKKALSTSLLIVKIHEFTLKNINKSNK